MNQISNIVYLAGQALTGLLSNPRYNHYSCESIAELAVEHATDVCEQLEQQFMERTNETSLPCDM